MGRTRMLWNKINFSQGLNISYPSLLVIYNCCSNFNIYFFSNLLQYNLSPENVAKGKTGMWKTTSFTAQSLAEVYEERTKDRVKNRGVSRREWGC